MSDEKEPIAKRGPEFDRGDFARAIEKVDGLPKAETLNLLDHLGRMLPQILAEHGRIELPGIGTFSLAHRYEKVCGKFVEVLGSMKVRFRPANDLRREIERLTGYDV